MTLEQMNDKLKELYGSQLNGQANFRLVWSEDQYEKRLSTFSDYYGHIFLRSVREVRYCKKYSWIDRRFILEKLVPNITPEELPCDGPLTYCPIFVFENVQGIALTPNWRATNLLVQHLLYGKRSKLSLATMAEQYDAELEADKQFMLEYLNNEFPAVAAQLVHGEGISVPNSYGDANASDNRISASNGDFGAEAGAN